MRQKFEILEEKVERILTYLGDLKQENASVRRENRKLRRELTDLRRSFEKLELSGIDQSDMIKTKLSSVLDRIRELEAIGL